MHVYGCTSYCMCVPSGREKQLSRLFRGNKQIINQSINPLIFSSGGMGKGATITYKHLAHFSAELEVEFPILGGDGLALMQFGVGLGGTEISTCDNCEYCHVRFNITDYRVNCAKLRQ